jgi:hypothetical protein
MTEYRLITTSDGGKLSIIEDKGNMILCASDDRFHWTEIAGLGPVDVCDIALGMLYAAWWKSPKTVEAYIDAMSDGKLQQTWRDRNDA